MNENNAVSNHNILLLGLPETGKTSYLAGFFHCVSAAEVERKKLVQRKMSKDDTYLNQIHTKWASCELLERTASVTGLSTGDVTIHLKDATSGKEFDLRIPDIAGESFTTQFADRVWERQYKASIVGSSGIILFINPTKITTHVLIDDMAPVLREFQDEEKSEIVEFDIEKTPTQVMLVDILDAHLEELSKEVYSVAIVLSAWDKILKEEIKLTPEKWIETNLPLLYQFLICNFEKITFKVFGISAQGGDLTTEESVNELQQHLEPANKIIVEENDSTHKNICAPIEWLVNQW